MANFITETLNKTSVIKIHNLMPKKIMTKGLKSELKDGFLFMSNENGRLMALQNLGFDPTEYELKHLKEHISAWGGGENVSVENGILEMELPRFLNPFVEMINNMPGCRVAPNMLRIKGDVYLSVEYPESFTRQISKIILEFLSTDHLFQKVLVYTGSVVTGIPILLRLYQEAGNTLTNFRMITTSWEFDQKNIFDENEGVFSNTGSFLPKSFGNVNEDHLIFRKNKDEVTGKAPHTVVDAENKIVEFKVSSKFYSDYFNQVVKKYSGPVFMHLTVTEKKLTTFNIIDVSHQDLFLRGLKKHWSLESRKNHINYIESVEYLEDVFHRFEETAKIGLETKSLQ